MFIGFAYITAKYSKEVAKSYLPFGGDLLSSSVYRIALGDMSVEV